MPLEVTEEEKIIICCSQLGGILRGLEERARLKMCCGGTPLNQELAQEAITTAEVAADKLGQVLRDLVGELP